MKESDTWNLWNLIHNDSSNTINEDNDEFETDEFDESCLMPFPETKGEYKGIRPIVNLRANSPDADVVCLGEHVSIWGREGAAGQEDVDECMEYIKLAAHYNENLDCGHRFKVRWMFIERVNPSHVVGIEYLYHEEEEPKFTAEMIRSLFHDQDELWSGVINTVQVKITKVNMNSDYFFENGPEFDNSMDGFE